MEVFVKEQIYYYNFSFKQIKHIIGHSAIFKMAPINWIILALIVLPLQLNESDTTSVLTAVKNVAGVF